MTTKTWLARTFITSLIAFILGDALGFAVYNEANPLPTLVATKAPMISACNTDPRVLWWWYICRVRRIGV